ncbi:hypothetical protein CLAVI_001009 [Candidatus Clavichlamydia salmonicola]|uniref:hypothetical protein n=1 Tax=Candidatus Clavichlamydia salmonicola TaxID=469812 RepID=UPI001890DC38|nr:hypothetical protein [Candidatus Clavichlamydia salmonicola]MBF5051366.1 hypothetical protein [Candidatus Clavichlamydia salmonicola]
MPVTTEMPVIEAPCSAITLVLGRAALLMTTLGKIIYKQCDSKAHKKPKGGSKKCRRLADLILEEGLL